jgi:hypothetical protein
MIPHPWFKWLRTVDLKKILRGAWTEDPSCQVSPNQDQQHGTEVPASILFPTATRQKSELGISDPGPFTLIALDRATAVPFFVTSLGLVVSMSWLFSMILIEIIYLY